MTEQEALEILKRDDDDMRTGYFCLNDFEAIEVGKKALEEVEKLRKENRALKNRCHAITHGTMCFFCPMDCSNRKEKYRGNEDGRD